jgi:hypothetical protein
MTLTFGDGNGDEQDTAPAPEKGGLDNTSLATLE